MRKKGGLAQSITSIILTLIGIGVFLAVLAQFGGNVGEFFRWILDIAWGIVTSIRDLVMSWGVFENIF